MIRRSFLASTLGLGLVVTALGCGGGKQYWHAQSVVAPGAVRILPTKVTVWGKLLYVDTQVVNDSGAPITVDRDQVTLVLPNGMTLARSEGTFTQHKGYVVMPGQSHPVNVDFKADGWKWSEIGNASVAFGNAVQVDGKPIALPLMPVSKYPLASQPVMAAPAPAPGPAPASDPASNGGGIEIKGGVEIKTRN
jgi:hypothetical protein